MDYYTICAQRTHFETIFVGRTVDTVRLSGAFSLTLGFDAPLALRLSCEPGMPFAYTLDRRFIPSRKAKSWHSGQLSGATLTSVEVTPGDRIIRFLFESGVTLVFEMTGRHANLILTGADSVIFGALRTVTGRESSFREIRPGVTYSPPPERSFPRPAWGTFSALELLYRESSTAGATVADALAASILAGSRLCTEETIVRAGLDSASPAEQVTGKSLHRLLAAAADIVRSAESGGEGATVVSDSSGLPREVFPMRMTSAGPSGRYFDDLDTAVERYAVERTRGLKIRSLRNAVSSSLAREAKSLKRTRVKVERECGESSEPDELEREGNTILAGMYLIKRGMSSVTIPDPYGGEETTVELDPVLDGPENAERFFTRARKLRAASKLAGERLASIDRRLADIATEQEHLATLDDIKELRDLAARYERRTSHERPTDPDQMFPRRFRSVSGLEIIVGRNDRENDELLKWAGRNDYWLHAQGVGGSHVILRRPSNKQEPDRRSLEQAASAAAYYSKAKTSAIVPVAYTQLKYVVKRRGQGPGQVTYTRETVIFAEPNKPTSQQGA